MLNAHGLADMGQKAPDPIELPGRPALPVDRVIDQPGEAGAAGPVHPHVQAVPGLAAGH